jgi:hypothetical protein
MTLWLHWWNAVFLLRPACVRLRTFMWFAAGVAGLTVRTDTLGVTSIVRALRLHARFYDRLLDHFHSAGVKLDEITALWAQVVLRLFSNPLRVNGRVVLVGDGIKVAKRGKKMPAVKLLHQQSDSNTKPEHIMGHSLQAVSLLARAADSVFAVPLAARIHEGLVWSNRDRRTLLDKMLTLISTVSIRQPFYFVADAYYAAGKIVRGLLAQNNHLVTRVRSNAVAYQPYLEPAAMRNRGRPKLYGPKVRLKSLLGDPTSMQSAKSPVYGEHNVEIRYHVCDLLWRPVGRRVRFVALAHPSRGSCLLMCTDTTLDAIEILRLYGLRFKIEHSFKQAVRLIGSFAYHFWMRDMKPLRRNNGNQHLHRETSEYRDAIKRKINAYHLFIHTGVVAQGLLQYLSATFPAQVWSSFGSWLRTIRPGIPPSELVVATALRHTMPVFLMTCGQSNPLAKFIVDRQDPDRMDLFRLAG